MKDLESTSREGRPLFRAATVFAFWTLVGLASALQAHVAATFEGESVTVWTSILRAVPVWWFWAFVTPAIAWLGRRFRLERGHWPRAVGVHLAAGVAASVLHAAWFVFFYDALGLTAGSIGMPRWEFFRIVVFSRLYLGILTYWAVLGGVYAFDYYHKYRERELKASRLEAQLAHSRLDALRMQLNPHFLFNALNAVAAQVRAGRGGQAVSMLDGLGDLLRYVLDTGDDPLVPLWQELAFLERFLEIERIRFEDRLTVEVDVALDIREARVPPLLLQPLVENALRHGVLPRDAPSRIEVSARRDDGRLLLSVRDDGVGLVGEGGRPGMGVGLANTSARLVELFGDRHVFRVRDRPEGGVEVLVEIPWSEGTT